jgi:membrane-bound lytic murein transglycosylase D
LTGRNHKTNPTVAWLAGALLALAGCETAKPAHTVREFVPPPVAIRTPSPVTLPPDPGIVTHPVVDYPAITVRIPAADRPRDSDFVIAEAERHMAAGRRALQNNDPAGARRAFDQAVAAVLAAGRPEDPIERQRLRLYLEDLSDTIYLYDLGPLGAGAGQGEGEETAVAPEEILEMTFPIDPSLRGRVREQVNAAVSALPLEENDYVLSFINYFRTERGRKVLMSGFARSGRYRDLIERILAEEGLPRELLFVAQQESRYDPRAISRTRNVGLWQFGASRGKEYGLIQTPLVDYRRDPEMATRAAARHLRDLYDHFGDWYLALAAYNCGPGCVDSAIFRTGYADFWELRRLRVLPLQTANYVPVILAITIMYKNLDFYGLGQVQFDPPVEYDSLELPSATHLALIADAVDRPLAELKELNPALLKLEAPAGYPVRVPKNTLEDLETGLAAIPPDKRKNWRLHRVAPGDTLASVAKKYGITPAQVSSANGGVLPAAGELAAIPVPYPAGGVRTRAALDSALISLAF